MRKLFLLSVLLLANNGLVQSKEVINSRFTSINRFIGASTARAALECRKKKDNFSEQEYERIKSFILESQNFSEYEFSDPAAILLANSILPKLNDKCASNPEIMNRVIKEFSTKYQVLFSNKTQSNQDMEDDIYRKHPIYDAKKTKVLISKYANLKNPGLELKAIRGKEVCREYPGENTRDCINKVHILEEGLRLAELKTYTEKTSQSYLDRYLVDCTKREILTIPLLSNSTKWLSVLNESIVADSCNKFVDNP